MERDRLDAFLDYLGVSPWPRRWQGQNYFCRCPLHDDQRASCSINPEKEVFGCFVCGGMTLPKLLQQVHEIPRWRDAVATFRQYGGGRIEWTRIAERLRSPPPPPPPRCLTEMQLKALPVADLRSRGVSLETTERFGVRYFPRYAAILFPYWTYPKHTYAGHTARFLRGEKKHKTPDGMRPHSLLYGIWESGAAESLRKGRRERVIVVEGAVDALRVAQLGYPVVSMTGCQVSLDQARILRRGHGALFFLDNDEAGWQGIHKARKFLGRSLTLWEATYPPGSEGMDPADLQDDQIQSAIENAKRV